MIEDNEMFQFNEKVEYFKSLIGREKERGREKE